MLGLDYLWEGTDHATTFGQDVTWGRTGRVSPLVQGRVL